MKQFCVDIKFRMDPGVEKLGFNYIDVVNKRLDNILRGKVFNDYVNSVPNDNEFTVQTALGVARQEFTVNIGFIDHIIHVKGTSTVPDTINVGMFYTFLTNEFISLGLNLNDVICDVTESRV